MQIRWRTVLATLAPLALGTAGAAGVHRRHAQPQVRCALPDREYVHGAPSPPGLALSHVAVLLRRIDAPLADPSTPKGEPIAYFQLNQATIQVGHCSISRVALSVRADGLWTLNFRADQNPTLAPGPVIVLPGRPVDPPVAPPVARDLGGASATILQTQHVKRNLFIVHVRGFAAFSADDPNLDASPGRPLVFDLAPRPFMVQRGVPEFLTFQGVDAAVGRDFVLIDRVEFELRFQ